MYHCRRITQLVRVPVLCRAMQAGRLGFEPQYADGILAYISPPPGGFVSTGRCGATAQLGHSLYLRRRAHRLQGRVFLNATAQLLRPFSFQEQNGILVPTTARTCSNNNNNGRCVFPLNNLFSSCRAGHPVSIVSSRRGCVENAAEPSYMHLHGGIAAVHECIFPTWRDGCDSGSSSEVTGQRGIWKCGFP